MALTRGSFSGKKSKLVILDADVIIHLHEIGLWQRFCDAYDVHVAETVAQECEFYDETSCLGKRLPIDFDEYVKSRIVTCIGLDAVELGSFRESRQEIADIELHAGEYESICILCTRLPEETQICTGDRAAIKAIVMLGYEDRCPSLESLLSLASLPIRRIDRSFSKKDVDEVKREASVRRVQNL